VSLHGMQEARGSNPLSSTSHNASTRPALGVACQQIAYVGDRLDNDVRPALAAGMVAVFLRRGPWGYIHARHPDTQRAALTIDSLEELPQFLEPFQEALGRVAITALLADLVHTKSTRGRSPQVPVASMGYEIAK
jgi:hypothetical protein